MELFYSRQQQQQYHHRHCLYLLHQAASVLLFLFFLRLKRLTIEQICQLDPRRFYAYNTPRSLIYLSPINCCCFLIPVNQLFCGFGTCLYYIKLAVFCFVFCFCCFCFFVFFVCVFFKPFTCFDFVDLISGRPGIV